VADETKTFKLFEDWSQRMDGFVWDRKTQFEEVIIRKLGSAIARPE
jgi:hypothetical protein